MNREALLRLASEGSVTAASLGALIASGEIDAEVIDEFRRTGLMLIGPPWSPDQRWAVDPGARLLPIEDKNEAVPGFGWWVPFGEGWEIPAGFQYDGVGPLDWSMWIQVIDGTAECVALKCSHPEGRPVTAEALRKLPVGRLLQEAVIKASRPAAEIPKRYVMWGSLEEAKDARAEVADTHRRKKRNPREQRPITDDLLRSVAQIYRNELAGGSPTKAVAEALNYSRASAGRLVMEARSRGYLPKTEQRKARA